MAWEVGFATNAGENTHFAHGLTFRTGLLELLAETVYLLGEANESDTVALWTVIKDIQDILKDPGIMDDPDQWEDKEFWVEDGHFYIFED